MKALSVSEAKMKLSGLIDAVNATDEEIVITKNGRPAAVLVSPEEFESLERNGRGSIGFIFNERDQKGTQSLENEKDRALHS